MVVMQETTREGACQAGTRVKHRIMRAAFVFLPLWFVAACTPTPSPRGVTSAPPVPKLAAVVPPVPVVENEASSGPAEDARVATAELSGIAFEGVAFDSRKHRLTVVDQPGGPGSLHADAAAAATAHGGIAAVNAGFFTPEGAPLGLVISSGKAAGSWNGASSLGSGIWHEDTAGRSAISRRGSFGRAGAAAMRELLQAGPLLVENGSAVGGLEATKTSARTILLWDGGRRWWIGRSSPCSLAVIATTLAQRGPAGWPVRQALNLDGGRSSELWVSPAVPGGPRQQRPVWNRPVRNFLVLSPR